MTFIICLFIVDIILNMVIIINHKVIKKRLDWICVNLSKREYEQERYRNK